MMTTRTWAFSNSSKDSSSLSQTSLLRELTGGLLMVAIPMLFAICVGHTGWAGFSAMILYLTGLLAQFCFLAERQRPCLGLRAAPREGAEGQLLVRALSPVYCTGIFWAAKRLL